jgi:tRNA pseudouridine55 synthase
VLLIDKPEGPTSHDVVARLRSVTRERSIGHTGTLDPRATGLLPLVLGKATRLAAVLTGADKTYDAVVRLGFATDTDDAAGRPLAEPRPCPPAGAVLQALDQFRGVISQVPPAHSAKKVGGHKAYDLARRDRSVELAPVRVTIHALEGARLDGDRLAVTVRATAGFYVRALARDLGAALGCGAHLAALRRTASGRFRIEDALSFDEAERLGAEVASRLIPPAEAVAHLPAVTVNDAGLRRVIHGNPLSPGHLEHPWIPSSAGDGPGVRILGPGGDLLALAHSRGGALHPAVVLA